MVCDFIHFKVCGVYLINKGRNSFPMPSTVCERSLFSASYVEIGYIEDACQKKKCVVSYAVAKPPLMVDSLLSRRPLQWLSKRAFIGPRCSKMQEDLPCHVIDAKMY